MSLQDQQQPVFPSDSTIIRGFKNRRYFRQSCRKLSYRQGKVYGEVSPIISEQSSSDQQQSSIIDFLKHRNQFFTSSPSQEQGIEKEVPSKHRRIGSSLSFRKKTQNKENCWKYSPPSMTPQGFNSYRKFTTRIGPLIESIQSLSKHRVDSVENHQSSEASILLSEEHSLLQVVERLRRLKISALLQEDLDAIESKRKESLGKTKQLILEEESCSQNVFDKISVSKKENENSLFPKSIDKNARLEEPRRHSMESTGSQDSFYSTISTLTDEPSHSLKDE